MTNKKRKILLLVEDKALGALISKKLKPLGARVIQGTSDYMDKIFDEVPHIIVMDEDFSNGQGKKIVHTFKEDMVLRYIPIVFLAEESDLVVSRDFEKIDAYVSKTKIQKNLLSQVKALIEKNHNELDFNPLTSCAGVRSTVLKIERAIDSKAPFAVCCVDLENLSTFNRAYGDSRGDQVIVRLSHIIQEALKYQGKEEDFVGHLGGDDFIVVTHSDFAERLAESIIQNFDAVIPGFYDSQDREQGYLVQRNKEGALTQYPIMSVSIAIVHNDARPKYRLPEISKISGDLKKYMKALPGSCYIQHRGKNKSTPELKNASFEVRFPSKMKSINIQVKQDDSERHLTFFKTLLKTKSIKTVYQPIVDLKNKRILGYEALTRALSDAPTPDAAFLFSTAREAGLVKELDEICVESALKNAQALGDKKLFLNLNHETLLDAKIMRRLFADRGAVGYKNIVIEVTEQSILRSFDKVRDALLHLKQQGVSVAIDDVGGGAVSLRDVAVLKPDYIKFDRSLIRQIDTSTTKQQIVLSMILFAKGIHALTTAEGIETREEHETVMMCGVNLGQGYYFAKPGPPFPKLSI